jgi:hypothetical protein
MTVTRDSLTFVCLLGLAAAGCDTLKCGPGTHRSGDECQPNVQVACGAGTVFADGRCVPVATPDAAPAADAGDGLTCGAGTHREGDECRPDRVLADVGPAPDGGALDARVAADAGPDGASADAAVADATPPDAAPPPRCPGDLEPAANPPADCGALAPGDYCVTGVAYDFTTNCALPADAHLVALLVDPIAAAAGQTIQQYSRGVTAIEPHGVFRVIGHGDSQALAVVVDEDARQMGIPDLWTRSVSGISAEASVPGQTYHVPIFASPKTAEARWSQALGHEAGFLETNGFMIGRVLEATPQGLAPRAGAEVTGTRNGNLAACTAGDSCLRFFDDDPRLVSFQPVGSRRTGASGAFLLIRGGAGAVQDRFFVADPQGYDAINAGANPGSAFHLIFAPHP